MWIDFNPDELFHMDWLARIDLECYIWKSSTLSYALIHISLYFTFFFVHCFDPYWFKFHSATFSIQIFFIYSHFVSDNR